MTLYYDPRSKTLLQEDYSNLPLVFNPLELIFSCQNDEPSQTDSHTSEDIESIIKAGKENNVDEMEIELNKKVIQSLDIKAFESLFGVSLTLGQEDNSCYRLKIKYKS